MTMVKAKRKRNIFLVTRSLLAEEHHPLRDHQDVARFVAQHHGSFGNGFKEASVIRTILHLIHEGVFESEIQAKIRFPELFQPSPERSIQHELSEQEAIRSETDALRQAINDTLGFSSVEGLRDAIEAPKPPPVTSLSDRPSLFPTYLTMTSQHKLLNLVQKLLEECCYDFADAWMHDHLVDKDWLCAEAVELGQWIQCLPRNFPSLPSHATTVSTAKEMKEKLEATVYIRHAAVHRLRTNAKEIERMLEKGIALAQMLKDDTRSLRLEILKQHFSTTTKNLELHKNSLETDFDQQLNDIEAERRRLAEEEERARSSVLMQDKEETSRICAIFAESISHLEAVDDSALLSAEPADTGTDATHSNIEIAEL